MEQNKKTSENQAGIGSYIKIARPDHWIKNVFIMPGLVLAVILSGKAVSVSEFIIKLLAGFLATCFIASANYVINEWLDAEFGCRLCRTHIVCHYTQPKSGRHRKHL